MKQVFQSSGCIQWPIAAGLCGGLAGILHLLESRDWQTVFATAWVACVWWVFGSAQLLWMRPSDWQAPSTRLHFAGLSMACGVVTLGLHIACALEKLGGHAAAIEHSARTAGVGWGVYVNYLFAVVWLTDSLWLTAATRSYARRPRWVGWMVHGFLAFIVFNATVVYGEPATRLAGVAWFAILGASWWRYSRTTAQNPVASEDNSKPEPISPLL